MNRSIFTNWRTSTRSSGGGNCVEVADGEEGLVVGVRDTKDRAGGTLVFGQKAWRGFIAGTKEGTFSLR